VRQRREVTGATGGSSLHEQQEEGVCPAARKHMRPGDAFDSRRSIVAPPLHSWAWRATKAVA
jgi:hypothetical protein